MVIGTVNKVRITEGLIGGVTGLLILRNLLINLFILLLLLSPFSIMAESDLSTNICNDNVKSKVMKSGWYFWEPYQYNKITPEGYKLSGMDIELVRAIATKLEVKLDYEQLSWQEHQEALMDGERDIAAGATYTDERASYAYFSVPYRFEENSLFVPADSDKKLSFDTIAEFLAQVRLQNFVLGVTRGFIYADPQINVFINEEGNKDIIKFYDSDNMILEALNNKNIDGMLADRVVGAAAILNKIGSESIEEVLLNVKTPIHLMFSKETVTPGVVDKFNREIKKFIPSKEYKDIVKTYLYSVLLLQTIDSDWFYIIGIIGTIAFAISGVAIAAKDNATLFGTFLFAMLPSVGGSIIRDILVNREEMRIFITPVYMYYILIVVLIGFSAVRMLEYYNKQSTEDSVIVKFWDNILVLGDTIGQASFVVTGVTIAVLARIEPIELWGPFIAFLTANGGGIIRDLLRKTHKIICLTGAINAEVAVIWGLVFSIYLDMNSHDPDPTGIKSAVIFVVLGAIATRMVAYYFNIPNIKFRADLAPEDVKKENIMP